MGETLPKHKLESLFAEARDPRQYVEGVLARMVELYQALDASKVADFIHILEQAVARNNAIYLIGNGGSAATASQIVNELCANSYAEGAAKIRAYSLTDNVPSITAIANDVGYESIFVRQLQQLLLPGDVVVAFSVSGTSKNIVKALEYANANEAVSVGICAFDGGWLAKHAQFAIHLPTTPDEFGPAEDIFGCLGHIASSYLTFKRGRRLAH